MQSVAGQGCCGRGARLAATLVGVSVLLVALGACKTTRNEEVRGWLFADPSQRHPIKVTEREVGIDLDVTAGGYGLTKLQVREAHDFVARYRSEGNGPLFVRAPSGGRNESAAMRALDDLRHVLKEERIPAASVVFEPYYGGSGNAPLRLSFLRYYAQAPDCGNWPADVGREPQNQNAPNFACATQRNLAAMVANPRDLVEPRAMTPRSGERRDVAWGKWVRGEASAAERSAEERATASEVSGAGSGGGGSQ